MVRDKIVMVLDEMEQKALQMKVQGVGVACFYSFEVAHRR